MPKLDRSKIRKGMYLTGDGNLDDCRGFFGTLRREAPARRPDPDTDEELQALREKHAASIAELTRRLEGVKASLDAYKKSRGK